MCSLRGKKAMKKIYLMTPGPTPVPTESLLAMAKPIIHHRTPQFMNIFKEANEGLKYIFNTKNDIFTFTSSGTGAMEASVVNFLSPGDKVMVIQGGKFGERFTEICKAYGVNAITLDVKWGNAVDLKTVEKKLSENPDTKILYATLCETSTAVLTDIKSLAGLLKNKNTILAVDAISGLGADELKTDEWGVDLVISGSQKGLMIPPGLAFLSVSPKAWGLAEKSKCPKFYFNLKDAKKALDSNDTPWTPALTLVIGLVEALKIIKEEGLENVIKRHAVLAEAVREAVKAMGLGIYSNSPSNAVTAVVVPPGVDGEKLVKTLRDKYGVTIAGGQADLKGKVFRVAHLGYMNRFDVIVAISAIENILSEMGYKFNLGSGIKRAEEILLKNSDAI